MSATKFLTSHQLAAALLSAPDLPIGTKAVGHYDFPDYRFPTISHIGAAEVDYCGHSFMLIGTEVENDSFGYSLKRTPA